MTNAEKGLLPRISIEYQTPTENDDAALRLDVAGTLINLSQIGNATPLVTTTTATPLTDAAATDIPFRSSIDPESSRRLLECESPQLQQGLHLNAQLLLATAVVRNNEANQQPQEGLATTTADADDDLTFEAGGGFQADDDSEENEPSSPPLPPPAELELPNQQDDNDQLLHPPEQEEDAIPPPPPAIAQQQHHHQPHQQQQQEEDAVPPPPPRSIQLILVCQACNSPITTSVVQCDKAACRDRMYLYCNETCFKHQQNGHSCSLTEPHQHHFVHEVVTTTEAHNFEWTDVNDKEIQTGSIYLRRVRMNHVERKELYRVVQNGYHLPTLCDITFTYKIGNTRQARKRTAHAATDNVSDFEQLVLPCPKDRERVECFLIFVFCMMGKRLRRDFFLFREDDITDIQTQIITYNDTGDMNFTLYGGTVRETVVSIKTFADDDTDDLFGEWWDRQGKRNGMNKPKTSAQINAAEYDELLWESNLAECIEHKDERNCWPPEMSGWIDEQRKLSRRKHKNNVLKQRTRLLREAGILKQSRMEDDASWWLKLHQLMEHVAEHKKLPRTSTTLGKWLTLQRGIAARIAARNEAQSDRIKSLRDLGLLKSGKDVRWDCMYKAVKDNIIHNTENQWPSAGPLYNWINAQRQSYFKGKLSDEKTKDLNSVGIDWWERFYQKQILNELCNAYRNGRLQDAFLKRAELAGYSRQFIHAKITQLGSNETLDQLFHWRIPVWKENEHNIMLLQYSD